MTSTKEKKLPLTHVDRVRKLRPELWDYLDRDIARLQKMGWQGSVASVDDFGSHEFEPCITFLFDKFIRDTAEKTGFSINTIKEHITKSPVAEQLLHAVNQDYHNLLNFELAGRKTFYFTENLTDQLLATELSIDADLVRPPFAASLFVLSGRSVIDALYAAIDQQPDINDYRYPLSVFVVALPDDTNPAWSKILISVSHWRGQERTVELKREVAIRPGWNINDALKTDWRALCEDDGGGFRLDLNGESCRVADEVFYTDGMALFRLVLNAVLYLASNDTDIINRLSGRTAAEIEAATIKSHTKAKKARQEARKESELDYASVGESAKPIYIRKDGELEPSLPIGGFREYAARFLVRGHWRLQACGSARTERRLTWIKPHYKGPEMAQLVNRPYIV